MFSRTSVLEATTDTHPWNITNVSIFELPTHVPRRELIPPFRSKDRMEQARQLLGYSFRGRYDATIVIP